MISRETIAYTTLWGGRYLAKIDGDQVIHAPEGDWSRSFTSDRIDYVTSSGARYVAKLEDGQFLHAHNGDFTQAHYSEHLDYTDWDGQSHFATLDQDLFTFENSEPEIYPYTYEKDGITVTKVQIELKKPEITVVTESPTIIIPPGFWDQFEPEPPQEEKPAFTIYHGVTADDDMSGPTASVSTASNPGASGPVIPYTSRELRFVGTLEGVSHRSHRIIGSKGDDILFGGSAHDILEGGDGNDIIFGGGKDDLIKGGAGADNLIGNGDDTILAGAGDDLIRVTGEDNILSGGTGADTFRFGIGPNSVYLRTPNFDGTTTTTALNHRSETGNNTVSDFEAEDKIEISRSSFRPNAFANDLLRGKAFAVDETVNLGASSGFRYLSNTGELFYDADGGSFSSGGRLIATFTNTPTLETINDRLFVV